MRHAWIVGCLTITLLFNPAIRIAAGAWPEHVIRQLNGQSPQIPIRAEFQYITGAEPELVITPYPVYVPEKDRLLMLVNRDRPATAALMHSDDHVRRLLEPDAVAVGRYTRTIDRRHVSGPDVPGPRETPGFLGRARYASSAQLRLRAILETV